MKARRYPDIDAYTKEFKQFQENYNIKKDFLDNKVIEEELIKWLNEQR